MYPHQNTHHNSPSGYPSSDDFGPRHQRRLAADGYVPNQQDQREHSTTCVPSLIPPGIDPSQVDVRTFFPYQPNEVKHRKRTTRPQLKVLEDVYKYDTKPAAALRKKLADELGMTPRGVQVWFQNRRAKEKNLARKAELAFEGGAAAIKKPLDLSTSAASSSSSPDPPASSSPTPVPANPSSSTETPSLSPSSGPHDATVTPPESSCSPPSSSSPVSNASIPRIDAPDVSGDESPFLQPTPESDEDASSYLLGTPTRPTAEALSLRRPSLPILSVTSSGSVGSVRGLAPRASIHGGGGSGMLSVSHGQSPPSGFDPVLRRRSVDTNIKRLSAHPYAHLARGTNDRFHGANPAHMHSLPSAGGLSVDGPGRLDGIPGSLGGAGRMGLGLRHGSMPHVLQSPARAPAAPDFPALHSARPTLTQKHSLPTFHEQHSPPPPLPLRDFDFHQVPLFTNPNPFASTDSAGPAPVYEYDSAVSPLAGAMHHAPASPSSASPPPIAQSLVGPYGVHITARAVPPPVPGPLPDAGFSFGDPAATSPSLASSGSSSPPSDHSTVVGMRRGSGDSAHEGDDTSAASSSSAYDPLSRFGSFASVDSRSSWTSYYSEGAPQDPKEGGGQLDVPDGFDPARRGSFASYRLPELLGGLDVTDHGPSPTEHADMSNEQSSYAPHVHTPYQDKQDAFAQGTYLSPDAGAFAPHGHHLVYPATGEDPYAQQGVSADVYATAFDKGPQVLPHHAHSSSELAYALQPPPPQNNMGANQHAFAMGYADGSAHPPAASDPSAGYDTAYEPQHAGAYDAQLGTHMDYNIYAGTPMYASGAVELDSMCVPATMTMDGISLGDYAHYA